MSVYDTAAMVIFYNQESKPMISFRYRRLMVTGWGCIVWGAVLCLFGTFLSSDVLYGADSKSSQEIPDKPVVLHYKIKAPSSPIPASASGPPAAAQPVLPPAAEHASSASNSAASPQSAGNAAPARPAENIATPATPAGNGTAPAAAAQNTAPANALENQSRPPSPAQPAAQAEKKTEPPQPAPETSSPPPAEKKSPASPQTPKAKKSAPAPVNPPATPSSPPDETTAHPAAEHPVHHAPAIQSDYGRKILDIQTHDSSKDSESIQIVLSGFFPPETQVIEGEAPKIICDFPNVWLERNIRRVIPVNGKFVQQIRTGVHSPPKSRSRIVIDLAPQHNYEVEQVYYQKDNIYSMVIREKKAVAK